MRSALRKRLTGSLADPHMREMAQGASLAFVLKVTGAGLALGFSIVLARMLSPEGMGIYVLALDIVMVATALGSVGLGLALLRIVAEHASTHSWSRVKGVYRVAMAIGLVASAGVTAAFFASARLMAEGIFSKPDLYPVLRWMLVATTPMVLLNLNAEALRGLKHIGRSQFVQGICVPCLSLLGLFFFGRFWGVVGAAWGYVLAALISAAMAILLWRFATTGLSSLTARFRAEDLLRSSLPLWGAALMSLVMNRVASISLGVWHTKSEVGLYSVAYRTAWSSAFFVSAVNSIAAPKFAELHEGGQKQVLAATLRRSALFTFVLSLPMIFMFLFMPKVVLTAFGTGFSEAAGALRILAVGQAVHAATASVGLLLIMTGHEAFYRNNVLLAAAVSLLLSIILVPRLGVTGAAVATSASLVTLNLASVYMASSRLGVSLVPGLRGSRRSL